MLFLNDKFERTGIMNYLQMTENAMSHVNDGMWLRMEWYYCAWMHAICGYWKTKITVGMIPCRWCDPFKKNIFLLLGWFPWEVERCSFITSMSSHFMVKDYEPFCWDDSHGSDAIPICAFSSKCECYVLKLKIFVTISFAKRIYASIVFSNLGNTHWAS